MESLRTVIRNTTTYVQFKICTFRIVWDPLELPKRARFLLCWKILWNCSADYQNARFDSNTGVSERAIANKSGIAQIL
jgi:hypothetical protein